MNDYNYPEREQLNVPEELRHRVELIDNAVHRIGGSIRAMGVSVESAAVAAPNTSLTEEILARLASAQTIEGNENVEKAA